MALASEKEIFKILNGFFDKIYIITLKRSEKRQALLEKSLQDLRYELFWGIDGRNHTLQTFIDEGLYNTQLSRQLRILNDQEPKDMLVNAVACALSHIGVYHDMIKKGYERVLILEDDIILAENFESSGLQDGLNELPEDWEFLYLGHLDNNLHGNFSTNLRIKLMNPIMNYMGYKRYSPKYRQKRYPEHYTGALNRPGYHYGMHAYAVSLAGAKKIAAYQTPVTREIDIATAEMCRFNFINAFSLKKLLFFQNRKVLPSMIEENRFKRSYQH